MADIDTSSSGGGKKDGKVRSKKQSTKVDMTPMVDLGFLLITFFMLTTTFSKPQSMDVIMPDKAPKDQPADVSKVDERMTVTLILDDKNTVYWYEGMNLPNKAPELNKTDFSPKGLRKLMQEKKAEKAALPKGKLIVVIKPLDKSKFKNVVDVLDEMAIVDVPVYAIVDITPEDIKLYENNK